MVPANGTLDNGDVNYVVVLRSSGSTPAVEAATNLRSPPEQAPTAKMRG